jgi:hypothetical protein
METDRSDLVDMINQIQSANILAHQKEIVSVLIHQPDSFTLSDAHKRILDERIAKYDSGEGKLYSEEEVLDSIRRK